METKRCTHCHKLQRVESQVCSRCGHSFERRRSSGGRSWYSSGSLFSLPAASPHHAGHYSGLHPEDQPYQSNKIVTPERFLDDILELEKEPLEEESGDMILSPREDDLVLHWDADISQVPTDRPIPPRRSRQQLASGNTSLGNPETQVTKDRDIPRRQISRPFVQDVLAATPQAQRVEASRVPTEVAPATYEQAFGLTEIQQPQKIQEIDDEYALQLPVEDQSFPTTNGATLLPEDLPSYMQEALRTKRGPSHIMSTALLAVGCSVLLATSIIVLVLLGARPTEPTPPHLHLSTYQANFGASASSVVSSQTITLENSGGGHVVWQESCDQPWLTTSLESGTFAVSENIQVIVNRQGLALGDYTGHVTFWLRGQENTHSVLNVSMTVVPTTAQLSISPTSLAYSTAQSQVPGNQTITISNTGEQALSWNATVSTPWLALSLSHGVLSSRASQTLTVQVQSQSLPVGTYHGLISFTGDANAQVEVSLTIVAPGNLVISPSSLAFTSGQSNQTLSLRNSGGLSLDWSVNPSTSAGRDWLSVTPASGRLAPGVSVNITVQARESRLAPGSYQGMLTFSSGDQTKQVSVSFVVTRKTPAPAPTPTPTPNTVPTSTPTPQPTSTSTPTLTPTNTRSPRIWPTEPPATDNNPSRKQF